MSNTFGAYTVFEVSVHAPVEECEGELFQKHPA